jgi:hypothetical protein
VGGELGGIRTARNQDAGKENRHLALIIYHPIPIKHDSNSPTINPPFFEEGVSAHGSPSPAS